MGTAPPDADSVAVVPPRPEGLAGKLAAYLGRLEVSQGPRAGEPFEVLPWQGDFLRLWNEPGDLALSVGRANGKTTLCAGLAAAALDGPLVQPRAETVLVAASFQQACIAFRHVRAFMFNGKKPDPSRWKVRDSTHLAQIECLRTGARLVAVGCNPSTAHGLAPGLVLMDEPAQWKRTDRDRMLAALKTSAGKIPGARLVALGTRSSDPGHWFERMLAGPGALSYSAPEDVALTDPAGWEAANPSLPYMPHLREVLEREAAEAEGDEMAAASFRALRLNQGTPDTAQRLVLEAGTWERIEGDADRVGPFVMGVDLSSGAAMSACAAYWPTSGRLEAFAAFPEVPGLRERGRLDQAGKLYTDMHRAGDLILSGRRVVDVGGLLAEVLRRWGRPAVVACDRWRLRELRQELEAVRFPVASLVPRGQGFKDGGEDMIAFRRACIGGEVVPARSLVMRAAMAEARTVADPAANEKLAKKVEGGRRARARDDAAAAAILAIAEGSRRRGAMVRPRTRLVAI